MVFISFYQLFANITKTVCLGTIFPPQYMWFSNVTASILLARLHNSIYYFNVNVRKFALVTRREPDVCMGLFIEIILGDGEGADWLAPPPFRFAHPTSSFFKFFFFKFLPFFSKFCQVFKLFPSIAETLCLGFITPVRVIQ